MFQRNQIIKYFVWSCQSSFQIVLELILTYEVRELTPPMPFRNSWSQAWVKEEDCDRLGKPM
jgi:hypothetical protein